MPPENDMQLDRILKSHLDTELRPHVGGSIRAFQEELARERAARTPSNMKIGVRWAMAASIAISMGVGISMVMNQFRSPGKQPVEQARTFPSPQAPMVQASSTWWKTIDEGTVMLDDQTPARMVRRLQFEEKRWKDASGQWKTELSVPNQDVIFVDMERH